jgi:glutamate carboxypeptidase
MASAQSVLFHLDFCRQRQAEMLSLLQRMVEIESPSDNKAALDRMGEFLAGEFERLGGKVTFDPQKEAGNHLKAEFGGGGFGDAVVGGAELSAAESGKAEAGGKGPDQDKPVLLLGHFDTVWPLGTLAQMPFRIDSGRAFGPGVYDMKAGITMMIFAIKALAAERKKQTSVAGPEKQNGFRNEHRPITILLDSDEEVGSTTGRPLVEATARDCEAVLVLEPSQGPKGFLKTSRKGVGDVTVRVRGRASHAGVDFEKGRSAIVELSRQLLEIVKFTDLGRGITVNPGVIHGGTRSNVVAAEAWVEVDLRIARASDAAALMQRFAALKTFDPACSIEISGGINRPPMERTSGTVRLFRTAQELGGALGMNVEESSTGGGSDGNFTSALGIPTLDGLGALGEGAHASNESIVIEELPRRTALLAGLLQSL